MTTHTPTSTTTIVLREKPRRRVSRSSIEIGVGLGILVAFVAMSFLAPVLTGYANDEFVGVPFQAPSAAHLFGTDALGRDVFVRTFAAVHIDYSVAALGAIISLAIGTLLGTAAGAARGRLWGTVMMRITDALIAIPVPLLILVITMTVGTQASLFGAPPGVAQILVAIFVIGWAIYARMARAEAMGLRTREYVVAAELMGYGRLRILFKHIMPRVLAVTMTYAVSDAVLIVGFVASLPFLGAGVPPPTPEWGAMMYEARASIVTGWWQVVFPALALTVSAIAAALIADGLMDRTSDRQRRR